jgi:hypothetical protein
MFVPVSFYLAVFFIFGSHEKVFHDPISTVDDFFHNLNISSSINAYLLNITVTIDHLNVFLVIKYLRDLDQSSVDLGSLSIIINLQGISKFAFTEIKVLRKLKSIKLIGENSDVIQCTLLGYSNSVELTNYKGSFTDFHEQFYRKNPNIHFTIHFSDFYPSLSPDIADRIETCYAVGEPDLSKCDLFVLEIETERFVNPVYVKKLQTRSIPDLSKYKELTSLRYRGRNEVFRTCKNLQHLEIDGYWRLERFQVYENLVHTLKSIEIRKSFVSGLNLDSLKFYRSLESLIRT